MTQQKKTSLVEQAKHFTVEERIADKIHSTFASAYAIGEKVSPEWLRTTLHSFGERVRSERDKEIVAIINSVKVEGNRVGNFTLGDKVMDFANDLLNVFKTKTIEAITPSDNNKV